MQKAAPHKEFIGAPGADGNCNCNMCPYMALNTLEKLYLSLRDLTPRIEIGEDMRLKALKPLERMLGMSGGTVGPGAVGQHKVTGGCLVIAGHGPDPLCSQHACRKPE